MMFIFPFASEYELGSFVKVLM